MESLHELEEALSTYTARAADKLRDGRLLATNLHVFVATNPFSSQQPQYSAGALSVLSPSNRTPDLIAAALCLLREIYRPNYRYKKTGIFVTGLIAESDIHPDLFDTAHESSKRINDLDRITDGLKPKTGTQRHPLRFNGREAAMGHASGKPLKEIHDAVG